MSIFRVIKYYHLIYCLVPLWPQTQIDPGTPSLPQSKNNHRGAGQVIKLVPAAAVFVFCDLKS